MNARNFIESSLPGQVSAESDQLSEVLASPQETGEPLRHILLGSPHSVRQAIYLLHTLRYAENTLWSPLVPIPNNQLIITPRPGDVVSILIKSGR